MNPANTAYETYYGDIAGGAGQSIQLQQFATIAEDNQIPPKMNRRVRRKVCLLPTGTKNPSLNNDSNLVKTICENAF